MSLIRRHEMPAVMVPLLALCLCLLPSCGGGGVGGDKLIIPEGCAVTEADLQGTWRINHAIKDLNCPAGSTLLTTATANSYAPVTVDRDESLPGFKITATGLTATVEDVTCHIVWTYLDAATNSQLDCFTTFHPPTRTAGGAAEAGHCSTVTRVNSNGSTGASCAIPAPYLDSYVVVTGS